MTLGVPVERMRFELGDSALPPAPVSGGSMHGGERRTGGAEAASVADPAVRRARTARADAAAATAGARMARAGRCLMAQAAPFVEATSEAKPGEEREALCDARVRRAVRAKCGSIADLGEIRVSRLVGAFDAGRVLNAKTARSQFIGGIIYGIGMALLEETHVDAETGRIVNANIAEYLVPVNADVPEIQTIIVPNDERTSNPLGVKGIGELPMVGVAAAVANAVYHATGSSGAEGADQDRGFADLAGRGADG